MSTWPDFLRQQGAQLVDDVVQHFGDPSAERLATQNATVVCDLSQFGLLRVAGEEAQTFLQNLLSNDIREVSPARAQLSSLNTPKGRILATFLIYRDGGDYLLQLPRALCDTIRKKLSMYVLRSKVKISDAGTERVLLGLAGESAQAILAGQTGGALPQHVLDAVAGEPVTLVKTGDTRFLLVLPADAAPSVWQNLSALAKPVGSACWDWLDIHAGIPVILPATQEQFVPQMANLEVIGGVNFKKGCYPGQEIVARMQYLGKPKRRMYLAHVDGPAAPQAGDELFSTDMEGQSSGMVVNATAAPQGGYDLLAVVQCASHDAHPLHLGAISGARLQFQPLPYPLPQN
ncbi:MAG: folate-binding protein YgfZ [Gallionella sp.]|nr:folate-binding protein YgfZ [Gallionella sp.]